ncbi:MAG: CPBP family intramembrane glutamic endopeptidase [Thermoguttaceae bacterium]|jgi:membrane protease YdiL (CAAX protease family)
MTPLLATSLREEIGQAAILALFLAVSAAIWAWIYARWQQGKPIIPLARRRPVPWQAQDVLFIFVIGLLLPIMATGAVRAWMGPEVAQQAADQKPELAHPAEQLLRTGTPGEKAIAVAMAVIVAPLVEEFFFRVLLQGWLEAIWSRRRRKRPELRSASVSWLPIVLPAALFALMHLRSGKEPLSKECLSVLFLAQIAADLITLGLVIALLRFAAGATAADLGWKPEKVRSDAKLGLLALLAAIGPVLTLQFVLMGLVNWARIDYAPDPIPLFFLALVLGFLYHRTHRLVPSLVLHMAFNATAIVGVFAGQ